MDSVLGGSADLTEPYWTVSGWYNDRARSEHLDLSCSVLGTESIFFTKVTRECARCFAQLTPLMKL
jgi:hypothetical protein